MALASLTLVNEWGAAPGQSGESRNTAVGQEQACAQLSQVALGHAAAVPVAVQDVEDISVALIRVVAFRIGGVGEGPRAARVRGGRRVS